MNNNIDWRNKDGFEAARLNLSTAIGVYVTVDEFEGMLDSLIDFKKEEKIIELMAKYGDFKDWQERIKWDQAKNEIFKIGPYNAKMLYTRWFSLPIKWIINVFGNKKFLIFEYGNNTLAKCIHWGYFDIVRKRDHHAFVYANRFIVDLVKKNNDGSYIGQFYFKIKKRMIFVGWFSLIEDKK
jgi:hypothetical protein